MIEIPRAMARRFRAVLRKCVRAGAPRGPGPPVLCRTGKGGLSLSCELGDVGLRYLLPGRLAARRVALPAAVLTELAGIDAADIHFEQPEPTKGRATWQQDGAPRELAFDTVDPAGLPVPPVPGRSAVEMPPTFLAALAEAARTAGRRADRFALTCVLLRGASGQVVGTDGRQLLLQAGFALPWAGEVLVPALPAFAAPELPGPGPVRLGRIGERVLLQAGPWLLTLRVEKDQRYPDVASVIPVGAGGPLLQLDPEDAEALADALPRLPGAEEPNAPVALELGPGGAVRAADGQDGGGVALARSHVEGPPARVVVDRRFLLRAIRLGFRTIAMTRPGCPLVCRDGSRTYVFMPLDPGQDAPASPDPSAPGNPDPRSERRTAPPGNDRTDTRATRDGTPVGDGPPDLLAEAEALRGLLQDGVARAGRLVAALRVQRRQTRALHAALASLRRLRQPDS